MILRLSNQQNEVRVPVPRLRQQLKAALPLLPRPLPKELESIEIILVDAATMCRVHANFLDDPTLTDVITFPYGEILVCPAVARKAAAQHRMTVEEETLLYALHGILHLVGYDDLVPTEARKMHRAQNKLLRQVLELA